MQSYLSEEQRDRAASALDWLIARGLVESASYPSHLAELCRELGIDPQSLKRKRWLQGATLSASDRETGEALASAFMAAGIPQGRDRGLRVVAVSDYLDPRLGTVESECRKARLPWMLLKLVGEEIWLGPIFRPGSPACWRCLAERLREKRWLESQLAVAGETVFTPHASETRLGAAAELAARETARWLLDAPGALVSQLRSFCWKSLDIERHWVSRHGNCPYCQEDGAPGAIKLNSVVVEWAPPGDLRICDTANLLARWRTLVSPITGVVNQLERRDMANAPLVHVYGALANIALPPKNLRAEFGIVQPAVCSGRGTTPAEAEAACLAEAVERYSIQFRGDERRFAARWRDLGESAIQPNQILLFSENQYGDRDAWNLHGNAANGVPERFDPDEEIEWMRGWSLATESERFLPMALAALYYRPPGKRWIATADSSGCAAGATLEEAVLHGILELVERDALAIWWYNQVELPAYEAVSLEDPLCRRACRQLGDAGWRVWVQEITTDLDIPAIVAIGANHEGQWIRGSGAHLHKATAVRRAVSELYQLSHAKTRMGQVPSYSRMESGGMDLGILTTRANDLKEMVEECCRKLMGAGCEVIAFDMTRPETDFPVVRVVAPGLRHSEPRFKAGRLFNVPVIMGWLPEARGECDLRKIPA